MKKLLLLSISIIFIQCVYSKDSHKIDITLIDSASFPFGYKKEYTYNSENKETEVISSYWDSKDLIWKKAHKESQGYDKNGDPSYLLSYFRDTTDNCWILEGEFRTLYDNFDKVVGDFSLDWNNNDSCWEGYKYLREYDNMGNETSSTYYGWDCSDTTWTPRSKDISEYNQNGNRTSYIGYNWDNSTDSWIRTSNIQETYNIYGDEISRIHSGRKTANDSFNIYYKTLKEYKYDNNNNKVSSVNIVYNWDTINNSWIKSKKYCCKYDSKGKMKFDSTFQWNNSKKIWIESCKRNYLEYDKNGNTVLIIRYEQNQPDSTLINKQKEEFEYDIFGNEKSETKYKWNKLDSLWEIQSTNQKTYDKNGNITSVAWSGESKEQYKYDNNNLKSTIYYSWDKANNSWLENKKREFIHDKNSKMLSETYYIWDKTNLSWRNETKTQYQYNESGNKTSIIGSDWLEKDKIWKIRSIVNYKYDKNQNLILKTEFEKTLLY